MTKCKIVLLGDPFVGKTSIINRYIFDNFTGNQQATVAVDFVSKTININNRILKMQLWDTAGQERFHSLIPSYIKDCTVAIVVVDLTSSSSFGSLNRWIDTVKNVRGEDALILVMGNKADLKTQTQENAHLAQTVQEKLKQMGMIYMEVSAKTGLNINSFFQEMAYAICGGNSKKPSQEPAQMKTPTKKTKSGVPQFTNAKSVNLNSSDFDQQHVGRKKWRCC